MLKIKFPYDLPREFPAEIYLGDHLGGFDQHGHNPTLAHIDQYCHTHNRKIKIYHHTVIAEVVQRLYSRIEFVWKFDLTSAMIFDSFRDYRYHPTLSYKNFICSFNGSDHVSRKLLVAALHRWGWFDPETCSKNFRFTVDKLDGHLGDHLDHDQRRFHRPFFIGAGSEIFFDRIYSFGHVRFDHARNIYNLERQLAHSFLHVVSESMATSYYPYVSEKFLYSVVTRGLFLAYAQPGWHDYVGRYYGFRRYDRIFDYRFDTIQNPVERLTELMSMISKFSVLGTDDWRDLYEMEIDTIEYNYDHYFSRRYLQRLETFSNV